MEPCASYKPGSLLGAAESGAPGSMFFSYGDIIAKLILLPLESMGGSNSVLRISNNVVASCDL